MAKYLSGVKPRGRSGELKAATGIIYYNKFCFDLVQTDTIKTV